MVKNVIDTRTAEEKLASLRNMLDCIDRNLLTLLGQRAKLVDDIKKIKALHWFPIVDVQRRNEKLQEWVQIGQAEWLCEEFASAMYTCIHDHAVKIQQEVPADGQEVTKDKE